MEQWYDMSMVQVPTPLLNGIAVLLIRSPTSMQYRNVFYTMPHFYTKPQSFYTKPKSVYTMPHFSSKAVVSLAQVRAAERGKELIATDRSV